MQMTHISKELGPRKQAVKSLEMTVRRALAVIKVFDELPKGSTDWTDADPRDLRNALGDEVFNPTMSVLPELWKRYKDGRLQEQVLELVANIVLESLPKKTRKEIEDGIARFR